MITSATISCVTAVSAATPFWISTARTWRIPLMRRSMSPVRRLSK